MSDTDNLSKRLQYKRNEITKNTEAEQQMATNIESFLTKEKELIKWKIPQKNLLRIPAR